jgi:beta-glucosidase
MPGSGPWATAHSKAVALVAMMTLEEKSNITVGSTTSTQCSGVTGSVPRLNWPGVCLSDAGNGLRNTDFVNGWPSGIHVGAAWNRELALQRGMQMGGEFKTKGVNVALGPVVGPLGRVFEGGRNWEGISNDRKLSIKCLREVLICSSISLRSTCCSDCDGCTRSRGHDFSQTLYRKW